MFKTELQMVHDIIVSAMLAFMPADSVEVIVPADTVLVEVPDTLPRLIPDLLPSDIFIPDDRLCGIFPWSYAPIVRPVFPIIDVYGFDGSIGFGEYSIQHPDKFFSTLEGRNLIDVPEFYVSRQMLVGNTLRLGRDIYYLSGIMYGSQMGVIGNNWGMGAREGLVWHPSSIITVMIWTQYFQSVSVYSPVVMPFFPPYVKVVKMPATPEVFSFGVQASFVVGEFIIGVGTSVAPVPFQDRHHYRFRYK